MSNGGTAGISTRVYKSGSIVFMEGDKSDYIYILKSGRVILTTKKVEEKIWVEVKENVKPGEFFGVKSALGKYPRDETAQTFGETVVLVLSLADFERLILKNVNVVKKMLKVFSNQLRRIHKEVREILGVSDSVNPEFELYKIAEFYFKAGRSKQALFAYRKYLEYYPDAKYSGNAQQRIKALQSGGDADDFQDDFEPAPPPSSAASSRENYDDLTDFTIDDGGSSRHDEFSDLMEEEPAKPAARSPLSSEMDDFLSTEKSEPMDDFTFDEPDLGGGASASQDISEIFYEGMRLFSQEQFGEALEMYKRVLDFKTLKNDGERKTFEKAHFEAGRCYLKLGNYNEAMAAFSGLIKKFPQSDLVKNALFYIGMVFEATRNVEKALTYYKKVASMEPKDQLNREAMNKVTKLQR